MILGSSLKGFLGLSLEQAIPIYYELSEKYDLNAVEIPLEFDFIEHCLMTDKKKVLLTEFVGNYDRSGAHLPYKYLDPVSLNDRIRKESLFQIKAAINFASEIGLDYCVLHIQSNCYDRERSEIIKQWLNVIHNLTQLAEEMEITLSIENAGLVLDLSELVRIVKSTDSKRLKLTLDLGHAHFRVISDPLNFPSLPLILRLSDVLFPAFYFLKGMPFEKYYSVSNFIRSESRHINNIHIHDYDGRKDHLPIGKGKIDFTILKEVSSSFQGTYIMEINSSNVMSDFQTSIPKIIELLS